MWLKLRRENGVAIVEANVGLLMAVSRGEVVGREKRAALSASYILVTEIDIPAPPHPANYTTWENAFLRWRPDAMAARYHQRERATPATTTHTQRDTLSVAR